MRQKILNVEQLIESFEQNNQKRLMEMQNTNKLMMNDFAQLNENCRLAQKSTDVLQVEYCKLIHSVNAEKRRNMDAINEVQRDLTQEVYNMKKLLIGDDKIREYVENSIT